MSITSTTCEKCHACVSLVVEKVVAGNSCRECGRYKFESGDPSYLYLLTHVGLKLNKVGIGTVDKDKGRLEQLLKDGWIAFGIWHGDQRKTFLWEKKIFAELKRYFAQEKLAEIEPFGNWVETWSEAISTEAISVANIEKMISKIIKS